MEQLEWFSNKTAPRYSYSDQNNQWQTIKGNIQHKIISSFTLKLSIFCAPHILLYGKTKKNKTPLPFHQLWVCLLAESIFFFPSRKWNYLAFVLLILLNSWMIYSLTLHSFNPRQRFRAFMSWIYLRKCRKYYISAGKINESLTWSHMKQRIPFTQANAWFNNEMQWLSHWHDSLPSSTLDEQEKNWYCCRPRIRRILQPDSRKCKGINWDLNCTEPDFFI